MPRPRSLTRPAIADAALAVIDREGLEALSIRSVALAPAPERGLGGVGRGDARRAHRRRLRGRDRVVAFRTLLSYVTGAVQVEQLGALSGKGTKVLARLPAAEYPHLSATARTAVDISPDAEFLGGLEVMLGGLGARER